jgi:hypothetical protein
MFYDFVYMTLGLLCLNFVGVVGHYIRIESQIHSEKYLIKMFNKKEITDSISIIRSKYDENKEYIVDVLERNTLFITEHSLNVIHIKTPSTDFIKNMIFLIRLSETTDSKTVSNFIINVMARLVLENICYLQKRKHFKQAFLIRLKMFDLPWLADYIKILDRFVPSYAKDDVDDDVDDDDDDDANNIYGYESCEEEEEEYENEDLGTTMTVESSENTVEVEPLNSETNENGIANNENENENINETNENGIANNENENMNNTPIPTNVDINLLENNIIPQINVENTTEDDTNNNVNNNQIINNDNINVVRIFAQ